MKETGSTEKFLLNQQYYAENWWTRDFFVESRPHYQGQVYFLRSIKTKAECCSRVALGSVETTVGRGSGRKTTGSSAQRQKGLLQFDYDLKQHILLQL